MTDANLIAGLVLFCFGVCLGYLVRDRGPAKDDIRKAVTAAFGKRQDEAGTHGRRKLGGALDRAQRDVLAALEKLKVL